MSLCIGENLKRLFSLENKVVLLTGAAGGIGSVMAEGFASVGAEVALCDVNVEKMNAVTQKILDNSGKASSHYVDVMKMDSIKECVQSVLDQYGRIDVLVNCAGINIREGFLDVEESTYDRIMNINLKGMYFISQEVAKHMLKNKKGNILTAHDILQNTDSVLSPVDHIPKNIELVVLPQVQILQHRLIFIPSSVNIRTDIIHKRIPSFSCRPATAC